MKAKRLLSLILVCIIVFSFTLYAFAANGAAAYHFGNSVSLSDLLSKMPEDRAVLGNIDPVSVLHNGTPESVRDAVGKLCDDCAGYKNFVLSTGCDVPLGTPWENINAFFKN